MLGYDKITNKLLLEEKSFDNKKGFLMSLYVDTRNFNTSDFKTIVNSWLRKGFEQNEKLKGNSRLRKHVLEQITNKYDNIREWGSGLGVFASFSGFDKPVKSWVVHFYHPPKDEVNISNIFDLDQLLWMGSIFSRSLILNLHFKTVDAFSLEGLEWKKLATLENVTFDDSPSRFLGVYSSIKGRGGAVYGSGESSMQRRREESVKKTFKDMLDTIKEDHKGINYDYIKVFYSSDYKNYLKSIKERIYKAFDKEAVLVDKRVEDENILRKNAVDFIRNVNKEKKAKALESAAKGSPSLYVTGWDKVAEVSKLSKIDTLFIKVDSKKKGYLIDGQVQTVKEDDAEMIENISPWLVRAVLNSSGKVVFFRNPLNEKGDVVSAKLRF